jgi:hypothetical protein
LCGARFRKQRMIPYDVPGFRGLGERGRARIAPAPGI